MSKPILDEMRDIMRRRHYSIRTEKTYCDWVKRYVKHFAMKSLTARSGKGDKDRVSTFPPSLRDPLQSHLEKVNHDLHACPPTGRRGRDQSA